MWGAASFLITLQLAAFVALLPTIASGIVTEGWVPFAVGLGNGLYTAGLLVMSLAVGAAVHRLARERICAFGLIGTSASTFATLFASNLWVFEGARLMAGISAGAVLALLLAFFWSGTSDDEREVGFALFNLGYAVGAVVGPAVAAVEFAVHDPWPLVVVAIATVTLALAFRRRFPKLQAVTQRNRADYGQWLSFSLIVVLMFALTALEVTIALRGRSGDGMTSGQAALLLVACGASMLVAQYLAIAFVPVRSRHMLLPLFMFMAAALAVLSVPVPLWAITLSLVVFAAGVTMAVTVLSAFGSSAGVAASGALLALTAIGQTVGAVTAGALFALGPLRSILISAVLLAFCTFPARRLTRQPS